MGHLRRAVRGYASSAGAALVTWGVSADGITWAGFFCALGCGAAVSLGLPIVGVALLAVAGAADLLDGAVARASGSSGPSGALLDSSLDRFGEAAIFVGIAVFGVRHGDFWTAPIAGFALGGGMAVSYVRAKVESLGGVTGTGGADRGVRLVVVGSALGLASLWPAALAWALCLLSVMVWVTAFSRLKQGRNSLNQNR